MKKIDELLIKGKVFATQKLSKKKAGNSHFISVAILALIACIAGAAWLKITDTQLTDIGAAVTQKVKDTFQ